MKNLALAATVGLALFNPNAVADSNFFATVGLANVSPNASSDPLNDFVEGFVGLPANSTSVDVDSNTQLGLTFGYKLNDHWSLELLAATPFSHTADAKLNGVQLVEVGDTNHLPPTLTVQYQFGDNTSAFRPFIGAGLNYTLFFNTDISQDLLDVLNSVDTDVNTDGVQSLGLTTANTDLDLSNSFGLALQAGFDYKINESWSVRATYWKIDIDTDAEVSVDGLGVVENANIQIDPNVFFIGAKYAF